MPRVPIDYKKTQIYKLVHKDDTENQNIYVGHTTNWIKRKNSHKSHCNNPNRKEYNQKKYVFIRENGGWNDWLMVWIEDFPCGSEPEAEAREGYWYKQLKATLNYNVPGRTDAEYREDNKKKIAEKNKKNYENNKEKIKEKNKKYWQEHKEQLAEDKITCDRCGIVIRRDSLRRHQKIKKCEELYKNNICPFINDD